MTAKQVFEYALIDLNKKDAPSLLLEDYNYFINKAINQYVNKIYNVYGVNQQRTDDLRVLTSSAVLIPNISSGWSTSNLLNNTYEVNLPDDYLHILSSVAEYTLVKNYKCYKLGDILQQGIKHATADAWSQLIKNYYLQPSYKNPYYYINNITTNNNFPTQDNQTSISGVYRTYTLDEVGDIVPNDTVTINGVTFTFKLNPIDILDVYCNPGNTNALENLYNSLISIQDSRFEYLIFGIGTIKGKSGSFTVSKVSDGANLTFSDSTINLVEKIAPNRYGNKSKVKMEIRYGKDSSIFGLTKVYIDYLKTPQFVKLTQDEIDEVEDTSQILEFPDYVCQEIVNELVHLLLENSSDPRLQTNIPITQSIASHQTQQKR